MRTKFIFYTFYFVFGYSLLTNNVVIVQMNSEGNQPYIKLVSIFSQNIGTPNGEPCIHCRLSGKIKITNTLITQI